MQEKKPDSKDVRIDIQRLEYGGGVPPQWRVVLTIAPMASNEEAWVWHNLIRDMLEKNKIVDAPMVTEQQELGIEIVK